MSKTNGKRDLSGMGRYRQKSPGRVAAAVRLNRLGLRGVGGRKPSHGLKMLAGLLKRGVDHETFVGRLLAERLACYVEDLGGRESLSEMEHGLCERLSEGDLFLALIRARLINAQGGPRRLAWSATKDVAVTHARLSDSYTRIAQALGLKRRAKVVDPGDAIAAKIAASKAGRVADG